MAASAGAGAGTRMGTALLARAGSWCPAPSGVARAPPVTGDEAVDQIGDRARLITLRALAIEHDLRVVARVAAQTPRGAGHRTRSRDRADRPACRFSMPEGAGWWRHRASAVRFRWRCGAPRHRCGKNPPRNGGRHGRAPPVAPPPCAPAAPAAAATRPYAAAFGKGMVGDHRRGRAQGRDADIRMAEQALQCVHQRCAEPRRKHPRRALRQTAQRAQARPFQRQRHAFFRLKRGDRQGVRKRLRLLPRRSPWRHRSARRRAPDRASGPAWRALPVPCGGSAGARQRANPPRCHADGAARHIEDQAVIAIACHQRVRISAARAQSISQA